MTEIGKPTAETMDKIQEHDASGQENAVGYREYLEGLDLEVSDREVIALPSLSFYTDSPDANRRCSTEESAGKLT